MVVFAPMSQVFLFTGENSFALGVEKSRWIHEFCAKHGEENCTIQPGKSLTLTHLLDEVSSMPFIAEKRLIVLDGIPKYEKGATKEILRALHPANLLLIIEPKPDKRLSFTKELLQEATVKTFEPLRGSTLSKWAVSYAMSLGATLSPQVCEYLLQAVGEDQMLLSTELQKLATFADGGDITRESVDTLVMLTQSQAGWRLMDLIAARKHTEALVFIRQLLQKGESPHALWNMLLWIASQITLVSAAVQEGDTNPASIAKTTGVPFPTARTLQPFVRTITQAQLQRIVQEFASSDTALKTGGYRVTSEAPEELQSLLDHCVLQMTSL